jgi:hypothetical protein
MPLKALRLICDDVRAIADDRLNAALEQQAKSP